MSGPGKVTSGERLEDRLLKIKKANNLNERNRLIEDYIPFIVKTVSSQLNRYIETENSDEFSIGMIAFNEAIDRYEPSRGNFLSFAELVIRNRVKDICRQNKTREKVICLEEYLSHKLAAGDSGEHSLTEDKIILREEILRYEKEIAKFDITFEDLVEESPKHSDTRRNAVLLAERISQDKLLVDELYRRRKLPVNKIVLKFKTTRKILKWSRKFIIAVIVIFAGDFSQLRLWVKNSIKGEQR